MNFCFVLDLLLIIITPYENWPKTKFCMHFIRYNEISLICRNLNLLKIYLWWLCPQRMSHQGSIGIINSILCFISKYQIKKLLQTMQPIRNFRSNTMSPTVFWNSAGKLKKAKKVNFPKNFDPTNYQRYPKLKI